jgi:hypothetical protein
MAFKRLEVQKYPPRQWALVGYPGAGKSSFAAQMAGPLLVVDSDHRFAEVADKAAGEVYELSDNPADNVDAERIAALLKQNMKGSGIKTVVIDSLTSILSPLVVEAIMDNDAGRNKNRVSAFKDKALALRLLQDTITGWGTATLWVYHLRSGMDGQAAQRENTSISAVELARLRRSLNMELRVMVDGQKRGVRIDWARRGRSGLTLWDESGAWQGMPERIEQAVYGGLTVEEQEVIEGAIPTTFSGPAAAIAWGFEQGCFRDAVHAQNAYDKLKAAIKPASAAAMWAAWVADVQRRIAEANEPLGDTKSTETEPDGDVIFA